MTMRAKVCELVDLNRIEEAAALVAAERTAVKGLFGLLFERYGERRWRAIEVLGKAVPLMENAEPEKGLDIIRRLFWSLNDESGGVGWSAAEAIGAIVAERPDLFGHFAPNLYYNYLDEPPVRRGILWAIGRIGEKSPELVAEAVPEVETLLHDPDPEVRGYAAWALGKLGVPSAGLNDLTADENSIELWDQGRLWRPTVGELARAALKPASRRYPYIDIDECVGCGACAEQCPEVFQLVDGRYAQVVNPEGAPEEEIQEAIDLCPVQCIHWDD